MKKLLGIVALLTVITAKAWAYPANCTFDGYPCSQWENMHDGW